MGSPKLLGREAEVRALDRLLVDALAGTSGVLVLRGDAGVGKSALLAYLAGQLSGWRVVAATGVESEMELAYSGLHQLCSPLLSNLDRLPVPQRDALSIVFGLSSGPPPDPFFVGLAVLTLLADASDRQPLVCLVDDAQWLDRASAQILGFVARRIHAERILIVCAARSGVGDHILAELPQLQIRGLEDGDARTVLSRSVHGPLDGAVFDQIVAESHGNPLALLELPRTWGAARLAGGFGVPDTRAVAGKIEQSYARRLDQLPAETRLLVLVAASEPLGDPVLLNRAAATLDLDVAAAAAAEDAGLLELGGRVAFAHPLVRSAAYSTATPEDRQRAHLALADATNPESDPDRRAWHLARAASGPDEEVAAELERSAGRAQARGGFAAAAAFLERAVALTVDPSRRAERALAAAQASFYAGAFDAARALLAASETEPLDDFQRARLDLLRGHVAFASGFGSDAPPLLLAAARKLEPFDAGLARETLLIAWAAAVFAGQLSAGDELSEIWRAAMAQNVDAPRPVDRLLDGLALLSTEGRAAAAPILREVGSAFAAGGISAEDSLRWGWLATAASDAVWDDVSTRAVAARQVQLVRDAGALAQLPIPLAALGLASAAIGDFPGAALLIAEAEGVAAATGGRIAPYTSLRLCALQGREDETTALIDATLEEAVAGGQGLAATNAHWAGAVLHNGLGHYEQALAAARQATSNTFEPWISMWCLPELIEAGVRAGHDELAAEGLERVLETTRPCDTDFSQGIESRCRAVLGGGDAAAEEHYREAIERLSRTRLRPELARAHLLYGEWLRRQDRRSDARIELRLAHDKLVVIGMEAFAERARRELVATGERVRKRVDETRGDLTPQEEQIARLARDGLTNPEIGAQLFLSPRTVEWHLRKVFTKLAIASRSELRTALGNGDRETTLV
jgi:DNA-binding CsgD family transcriptional regulator